MKKLMLALAFAGFATATVAQENVPVKKHSVSTNSFWANWYVSAGGAYNATYTSQEFDVTANPFTHKRGTFSGTLALGKWFTPGLGLRTVVDAGWLRNVYTDNHAGHPTVGFWKVSEDVMFNMSNLIYGYNEKRIWNVSPYIGVTYLRNCSDDKASFGLNFGIHNNFRLSKRFSAFADLAFTAVNNDVIGAVAQPGVRAVGKNFEMRGWDKVASLKLGITYQISKTCTWEKTPDLAAIMAMNQEQVDAVNEQLAAEQQETERLRVLLAQAEAKEPEVRIVKEVEFIGTSASVFFNTESARIASRKDLVNVKEIAEFAKENGKTIVVTGYADSRTGAADYNQKLSEKRANTVAKELVKMGVSEDKIIVKAEGGVDAIAPYSYNRRATVKIQ